MPPKKKTSRPQPPAPPKDPPGVEKPPRVTRQREEAPQDSKTVPVLRIYMKSGCSLDVMYSTAETAIEAHAAICEMLRKAPQDRAGMFGCKQTIVSKDGVKEIPHLGVDYRGMDAVRLMLLVPEDAAEELDDDADEVTD